MRRRCLRVFSLWTAIFAVLMAALAPAITQAMQRGVAADDLFICTQSASRWTSSDASAPDGRKNLPDDGHAFDHCPYCSVHAAGLGMPPPVFEPLALPLSHALHWRYSATTPFLDFWSDALSRGPPPGLIRA